MAEYYKDFWRWAKVASVIEKRKARNEIKVGAVYWCNLGVNIGSTECGKGEYFTRPVLVLAKVNQTRFLIIPISSQKKSGVNYREIVVAGRIEYLLFDQMTTIDERCMGDFVDEVAPGNLRTLQNALLRIMKYHFYKNKSEP